MKINIEQLKQIQEKLSKLSEYGIGINDESGYLAEDEYDELPDEMEIEDISFTFPDDQDYNSVDLEDFLDYTSEGIETIRKVEETMVRNGNIVQAVINSVRIGFSGFEERLESFEFEGDLVSASIVKNPFLVGILNAKEGKYDEDFGLGSCEPYWAIEFRLKDGFNEKKLTDLVEQICFYLTDQLEVEIYPWEGPDFNDMYDQMEDYYRDGDDEDNAGSSDVDEEKSKVNLSSLPNFTPLLKMYRQARGVMNQEIQFLQYYKIIEYVSPVVARSVAYEHMNKRLDLLPSVRRDHQYLDSVLSVARKYDKDMRDDTLALAVIENCVDVLPLYEMLPQRLRKQVKAILKLQKDALVDEDVTDEQERGLQRQIAAILYATRNSIVHAKSNYEATGNEIMENELGEANQMMNIIARSIINWNQRQPEWSRV